MFSVSPYRVFRSFLPFKYQYGRSILVEIARIFAELNDFWRKQNFGEEHFLCHNRLIDELILDHCAE